MCGSGASRNTTSGGLSPIRKVKSISIYNWGVVLATSSRRVKMSGNPRMLGLGTEAATPAMVLQVQ